MLVSAVLSELAHIINVFVFTSIFPEARPEINNSSLSKFKLVV